MPELPEVHFVVTALNASIKDRRIEAAQLIRSRLAPDTDPQTFADELAGSSVNFVHRRGKNILVDLSNGRTLLTHLRMSGRFLLLPDEKPDPKFAHAVFYFDDGYRLVFDDQRHFGLMKVLKTSDVHASREIVKLAPEPLSDQFSPSYFRSTLLSSKRSIKETLLDQTKVCGLGNIYAAEALFLSGIDPRKRASSLSAKRSGQLHAMIRQVLQQAISIGAEFPVDPEDISGNSYGAGSETAWLVYDRESSPCHKCEKPITRITQGGRSSYFCRKCQRP